MSRITSAALLAAPLLLLGCASGGGSAPRAPRPDPNRIVIEEVRAAEGEGIGNLFDLIRSRRPNWLIQAPTTFSGRGADIALWVDGIRVGDRSNLVQIPITMIQSVRLMTPSEAQGAFGLNNLGGAISVTTRGRDTGRPM